MSAASHHPILSPDEMKRLFPTLAAASRQAKALESIVNSMGDGVVVVDEEGKLLLANPAAARILRNDLVDMPRSEWSARYGLLMPDMRTPYPASQLPLVRAVEGESCDGVEIFLRHSGVPEGAWLSVTARPLCNEDGKVKGGVVVFRDITDRKRAEQEHAALLERAQAAQREAEETVALERSIEHRLELLIQASGTLFHSLNIREVLATVLDLARDMIDADAYAIWRADDPNSEWRIACSSGLSDAYQSDTVRPPWPQHALTAPLILEDVLAAPLVQNRAEAYRSEGIRSLLAVPLRLRDKSSGTITFYARQPRRFTDLEVSSAAALANLTAAAIAAAESYENQSRMRALAEEGERRSAFLAQATAILGSSLDYEVTLAQVSRLAVPHMADWCAVEILQPDGASRQLALSHVDPAKVEWAWELRRRYPPEPDEPNGISHVLRTGLPELLTDIPDDLLVNYARDREHLEMLRGIGCTSYMCVPIIARDRVLGAITFVAAESRRRYGSEDLAVAEHLGRRAALAIDNALLFQQAQRDRAAAEQSLEASQRSEVRLRRLVESGIIGIILGEQDQITEANDVFLQMIGYTREELLAGKLRWPDLTAPEFVEADTRARAQTLSRGACVPYEKEYLRKDGTRVPALLGAALLEARPRFTWVAFVLDLSERKRLEERLRETQKLDSIGLLAGGIAHDFNNILTGILGNASLMLDDLPPGSPFRPPVEAVVHASERAADLTRQLLAYSGKGRFVVQPLNISEAVRSLLPLLQMSIPKKIQLRLDLHEDVPFIEADSAQLQQLVMNLVLNGAEAIGESVGTVLVATGIEDVTSDYLPGPFAQEQLPVGRYAVLEIQDTGCGMDDDTISHIFDPFFTTKFTGRGLGLAAVLGIVRGHNGDIRVRSRPGEGSTFRVLLPVSQRCSAEQKIATPQPTPELHGMGTVLVIDDETVVLATAKAALERYGYRVLEAGDGREGVEVFGQFANEISLVLLDMAMPVMSGEEALARLRAIRPGVPVIVSSGYSEWEAMRRFRGTKVTGFIQKPYTGGALAAKIKEALAS